MEVYNFTFILRSAFINSKIFYFSQILIDLHRNINSLLCATQIRALTWKIVTAKSLKPQYIYKCYTKYCKKQLDTLSIYVRELLLCVVLNTNAKVNKHSNTQI